MTSVWVVLIIAAVVGVPAAMTWLAAKEIRDEIRALREQRETEEP
jgi:hypothetical protein